MLPSPNNDIKTRRHSFHHKSVRETVLGAGLCTLSKIPHTLIDQALSLTVQGKNMIHKLSPERKSARGDRPSPIFSKDRNTTCSNDVQARQLTAECYDHDFVIRRQEELRRSPVSSDSFDASERSSTSFNPELFEEDFNQIKADTGHKDPEFIQTSNCDANSLSELNSVNTMEHTIVQELSKRYFDFAEIALEL